MKTMSPLKLCATLWLYITHVNIHTCTGTHRHTRNVITWSLTSNESNKNRTDPRVGCSAAG